MRQHDVGLISNRLQAHYQEEKNPAELEDIIDDSGHFQDTKSLDLHIYSRSVFQNFEQQLKTDKSYYSSDQKSFQAESFLPDVENIHIWYGYRCQTRVDIVLPSTQIKYKALESFVAVSDEPGYIVIYKLETRRSTYRCLEIDLEK